MKLLKNDQFWSGFLHVIHDFISQRRPTDVYSPFREITSQIISRKVPSDVNLSLSGTQIQVRTNREL